MGILKKILHRHIIPVIGKPFIRKTTIPIIYYHNIVKDGKGYSFMHVEISIFKKHMNYLKENGYKTYTFDEIPDKFVKDPENKDVIITFDDGFFSNYDTVYTIIKNLHLKFNVFLTTSYIETENYLKWDMIKEMSSSKLVGFGAHTFSHIDSRKINEKNYEKEILLTNELIKKHTLGDINDFCFPFGYYNNKIIENLCEKKVYKRLYTSDYMKLKQVNGCEVIGRIPISNDYDVVDFRKQLEGYYDIMYYYRFLRKLLRDTK